MASGAGCGCALHSEDGSCRSGAALRRVHRAAQNDASKALPGAGAAAMLAAAAMGMCAGRLSSRAVLGVL